MINNYTLNTNTMKNKTLIMILVAVIFLLPATIQKTLAQNTVAEIVPKYSKSSIVREYAKNSFLAYNDDGNNNKSFNLINLATNTYDSLPVGNLMVHDMEIIDTMAYFCGQWNRKVVAGWFSIPAVFSSGGIIEYIVIPATLPCSVAPSTASETIQSLDRLEVIDFGSSYSHLVMIGSALCTDVATPTQCIVEIFHDGTDWKVAYQVEHLDIFHYDDISVTANDVVVVGHKKYTNGEYIKSFIYPTMNNPSVFTASTIYTHASGFLHYSPHYDSEILIDDIPGTPKFATVCQAEYCTSPNNCFEGTFLNLYFGVSNVIFRCRIDDYHDLTYKEIKYNKNKNSFLLLMKDCSTNMHNGYYEFELDNTQSFVTNVSFHQDLNHNEYYSIDKYTRENAKKQCVLTGYNSTHDFVIWLHDLVKENKCSETTPIPFVSIPTDSYHFEYNFPCSDITVILNKYIVAKETKTIKIICDENDEK